MRIPTTQEIEEIRKTVELYYNIIVVSLRAKENAKDFTIIIKGEEKK